MSLPKTFNPVVHDESAIKAKSKFYTKFGETDMQVFRVSLGTASFANNVDFNENDLPEGPEYDVRKSTLLTAIKEGINLIDTAPLYCAGRSERVLGEALLEIPRNSYYLATKVGRTHGCRFDYTTIGVRETFLKSLQNLRVEHVDLVTIHDVEFPDDPSLINSTVIPVLESLKKEGKIKRIGVSAYPLKPIEDLLSIASDKIDYVLSYSRLSLFNQDLLASKSIVDKASLGLINAAYLGMGLLTSNVLNDPPLPLFHPARNVPELVNSCRRAASACKGKGLDLVRIATDYAFKQSDRIATHLVGMNTPQEVQSALSLLTRELSEDEKSMQNDVLKLFSSCPRTEWEGFEVRSYNDNQKVFEDNLVRILS